MTDTLTGRATPEHAVITTVDPATGQPIAEYLPTGPRGIEQALDAAVRARRAWAATTVATRCHVLGRVAHALRARREQLAGLVTAEMGKPLREALAEVDKCALGCEYYAEHAVRILARERVVTAAADSFVSYEPLGTVLAVMPWNFPLWQAVRAAAPALVAGNALLLKHAPNTTGCALALAEVFGAAGVPPGVFGVVVLSAEDTPAAVERIIADDRVAAVTLTGSERAGAAVAAAAGRAIKPSVLELGGSDPFVILADADIRTTVQQAIRARFLNAGQSCIAAKRFVVAAAIADQFTAELADAVGALVVGDPRDPAVDVGPLARADLVEVIDDQVRRSIGAGARLVVGGSRLDGPGFFYRPTVLADVRPAMAVCAEETFGPVAAVLVASDDAHAISLANDTRWGLGASVWTSDPARGREVARRLRSGSVFVNAVVASDPVLPFGGVGRSGYGRELGASGLLEFVNVRSWWLADSPASSEETSG